MLEKVRAFVSKEAVLVVAVLAAAVSCALVPFDEGYASYVDWRTLTLLFCLMAVVTGLRFMGVMRLLAAGLCLVLLLCAPWRSRWLR